MKYETATIASLMLDPANVRTHDSKNLEAIKASLARFGQQKPIVVDAKGIIVAGNGTMMAAKMLNWSSVEIVRTKLEGAEAIAYAIADNRTAELAGWDEAALAQQLAALQIDDEELANIAGFTNAEIEAMILAEKEIVEDEVPEPPVDPITKTGDLWLLGDHRVLCGDSTKAEDVARLMNKHKINLAFTSPPYASQRKYDESSGFKPIPPDNFVNWFAPIAQNVKNNLQSDGSWFVNIKPACDDLSRLTYVFDLVLAHIRMWGWNFAEEFCWERSGIPQQVVRRFKNQFEPIYQFTLGDWKFNPESVRHPSKSVPKAFGKGAGDTNAAKRQGIVSAVDGNEICEGLAYPGNRIPKFQSEALGHAAAFPVGLPSFFIQAFSDQSDVVYDPFLGSGSTLIAADQLNRKCYGMEISPAYCDVIVKRWETLTGKTATLST